jgi:hypothetical protein
VRRRTDLCCTIGDPRIESILDDSANRRENGTEVDIRSQMARVPSRLDIMEVALNPPPGVSHHCDQISFTMNHIRGKIRGH